MCVSARGCLHVRVSAGLDPLGSQSRARAVRRANSLAKVVLRARGRGPGGPFTAALQLARQVLHAGALQRNLSKFFVTRRSSPDGRRLGSRVSPAVADIPQLTAVHRRGESSTSGGSKISVRRAMRRRDARAETWAGPGKVLRLGAKCPPHTAHCAAARWSSGGQRGAFARALCTHSQCGPRPREGAITLSRSGAFGGQMRRERRGHSQRVRRSSRDVCCLLFALTPEPLSPGRRPGGVEKCGARQ